MFSRSVLADETQESVIGPLLNTGKDWLTCHRGQKSTRSNSAGEKSDRQKKKRVNTIVIINLQVQLCCTKPVQFSQRGLYSQSLTRGILDKTVVSGSLV